jgi:hypothetical protein
MTTATTHHHHPPPTPTTQSHVAAYKKFDLWSTPDVLILHLKRFEYIPGQYFMHRQKVMVRLAG